MPIFNVQNEDDYHFVNFLWNSPESGLLYINKIVWNGYGDPIKLFGIKIEDNGLSDLQLEVFQHTPNWTSLSHRLDSYREYYRESALSQHIFGELTDYMSMYLN